MRKTRLIAAVGALLFTATMGTAVSASAAPTPNPSTPASAPVIDKTHDSHASIADEVSAAHKAKPPKVAPTKRPKEMFSPKGGERIVGVWDTSSGQASVVCTNGFNARSGSGAYYSITAGHCGAGGGGVGTKWFYPDNPASTTQFGTMANVQYNSTGDRAAIRDLHAMDRQVKTSCCLYTVSGSRDPIVNEQDCFALGKFGSTVCGYVYWVDQHVTYQDGSDHGNLAIAQSFASSGCAVPGDSGSPALHGTVAVGIATAAEVEGPYCYIWFDQLQYTQQALGVNVIF